MKVRPLGARTSRPPRLVVRRSGHFVRGGGSAAALPCGANLKMQIIVQGSHVPTRSSVFSVPFCASVILWYDVPDEAIAT